jgi:hypothetical protein
MVTLRKPVACVAAIVLALVLPVLSAGAQGAVRVFVDGDQVLFDQPPVSQGGRILVPLRGIFEQMGAVVEWNAMTRTVRAARGTTLVELQIGSRIARVDGRAMTLDAPPMVIGGRTLVPLRFISEALGATVDYRADSRTVLISTPGQAGPPASPPPPPGQTISGVITTVTPAQSPTAQPRISVESGSVAYRIGITLETSITRVEVTTNTGGSVGVAALRPGDDAQVTVQEGVATRVRATYRMTSGKIEAIARAGRTLVLTDGRTIRYASTVLVSINGQPASGGIDALNVGQVVEMRQNPTSGEAWEIVILTQASQPPAPGQMKLTVTDPKAGAAVANPVAVSGTTAPGSRVEIVVTWILGVQVGRQVVTADAQGKFTTNVPVNVISRGTPYLINVVATHAQLGQEQAQFTVVIN